MDMGYQCGYTLLLVLICVYLDYCFSQKGKIVPAFQPGSLDLLAKLKSKSSSDIRQLLSPDEENPMKKSMSSSKLCMAAMFIPEVSIYNFTNLQI